MKRKLLRFHFLLFHSHHHFSVEEDCRFIHCQICIHHRWAKCNVYLANETEDISMEVDFPFYLTVYSKRFFQILFLFFISISIFDRINKHENFLSGDVSYQWFLSMHNLPSFWHQSRLKALLQRYRLIEIFLPRNFEPDLKFIHCKFILSYDLEKET